MTGADLLRRVSPPIELMEKLEQTPNLPESIKAWYKLWRDIRSDGPSEIDGVSDEVYQQAAKIIEDDLDNFTLFADIKPVVQTSLFTVEEKAKVY